MTDVALRDHVKLTLGESTVVGTVTYLYRHPSTFIDIAIDRDDSGARSFDLDKWTLTKIPKPLPTEPGLYISAADELSTLPVIFAYDMNGEWASDNYGEWSAISDASVPRDLVRLVKES